jgi:hypothetical protein
MQNPASLRSDGWQLCSGPGGSFHVEWVATFSGLRKLTVERDFLDSALTRIR